ncbi:MAG TPA: lytic transglycosylase domain-containing protein [Armatimonadota bacterium]
MIPHVQNVMDRIAEIKGRFPQQNEPVAAHLFASKLQAALPTDASPLQPFSETGAPGPAAYEPMIADASARHGVDPAILRSVIKAESGFNPKAVSSAGAQGLMQLMPATARALGVADSFDPAQNIDGGARYLRHLLDKFGGNTSLAVAAYNAGPGSVEKYGGVPPFAETREYVQRVTGLINSDDSGSARRG